MNFSQRLAALMDENGYTNYRLAKLLDCHQSAVANWVTGKNKPQKHTMMRIADVFGVSVDYLKGVSAEKETIPPGITNDIVTFNVIGDVAAGYDHIASSDWYSDLVDIPRSWLHNHPESDFFVLRVKGDSMYPLYQDGDIVLVKKQTTMNRSGEIGVVIYGDELATLKKIEYVMGEDWMRLIPINPNYPPIVIKNEELEHCRVLGLPIMLIRDINQ